MPARTLTLLSYDANCVDLRFRNRAPASESATLSLPDALPITIVIPPYLSLPARKAREQTGSHDDTQHVARSSLLPRLPTSEEHTSELQLLRHLVCRLPLEKKKHDLVVRKPRTDLA